MPVKWADCVMNSKSEFHQAPLVRVVPVNGLVEEEDGGWSRQLAVSLFGNMIWWHEKYWWSPKSIRRQDPNNYSDTETRALSTPELSLGDVRGHLHPANNDENTKGFATLLILERVQISQSAVLLPSLGNQNLMRIFMRMCCDTIWRLSVQ